MSANDVGRKRQSPELADLGLRYMMSDLGRSQACLAEEEIMGLAGQGTALASHPQGDHVVGCTRCASRGDSTAKSWQPSQ